MIKINFITLIIGLLFNQAFISAEKFGNYWSWDDTAKFNVTGTNWMYTNNWKKTVNRKDIYNFKGMKGTLKEGSESDGPPFNLSITHYLVRPTTIGEHTFEGISLNSESSWESANIGLKTKTSSSADNAIEVQIDAGNIINSSIYKKLDDTSAYALLKDKEMAIFAIPSSSKPVEREVSKKINDTKNTADALVELQQT